MNSDEMDEWQRKHADIQALKNQVKGIGYDTAKIIIDEFGSIDKLETVTEDEVTSISGIGSTTTARIGIWNDQGQPVNSILRDPCPVCGDEYHDDLENTYDLETTLDVSNYNKVCLNVTHPRGGGIGSSSPTTTRVLKHR